MECGITKIVHQIKQELMFKAGHLLLIKQSIGFASDEQVHVVVLKL